LSRIGRYVQTKNGADITVSHRLKTGSAIKELRLESIHSTEIHIPDPARTIHLQFRRFAGCPICDLHLHSVAQRHRELTDTSVREVVVFHSTADELLPFCGTMPFETVADPRKLLYAHFGVESGLRALASPRVWIPIVLGVLRSLRETMLQRAPLPTLNPHGGRLGLPAEFLIAPSGVILACKYGSHAYDQWSVDEILALSHKARSQAAFAIHPGHTG
jgi:AhpC/TSA antioxidant enzyme